MKSFFSFNATSATEIYTLSLHDALPIYHIPSGTRGANRCPSSRLRPEEGACQSAEAFHAGDEDGSETRRKNQIDRKSTRLNSSHVEISYAVFCLKKKKRKRKKSELKIRS